MPERAGNRPFVDWLEPVHEDDRQRVRQAVAASVASGRPLNIEFRVRWSDASVRRLKAAANVHQGPGGPKRMVGVCWDVTELHELGVALARQNELMRVTMASIGDAVLTTDEQGRVTWLNPVAERMTGWTSTEAVGRASGQVLHLVHQTTREPAESPIDACLRSQDTAGMAHQTVLIARSGVEYGIEDSASPIRAADGAILGSVLVFHDVTEQRRISGEMTYRATHDALTGLVNRAEFESRLKRVLEVAHQRDSQHALFYIDLDQFKLVNDACGHSVGDQLLQQISKLLTEIVRSRDTLARLGGDEFAVILEHCEVEQAQRVAQAICDRMDDFRFIHDERRFRIGASIGLVPIDSRWATTSAAMQAADASCYAAKEAGRNRVHVWFDSDAAMRTRHGQTQWATRLEQALDEEAFVLHLQRIIPLKAENQGLHAEVLLRLRDVDGSLIAPGVFLPAAERFHLAARIDRWVIHRVVQQLAGLPSLAGIEMIAVNLSGQSVGDRSFHRAAFEELWAAGPQVCRRLCIEITETAAITNMSEAALFIEQLREMGVRTALDDFGAGASSFGYLKTLKVNVLKIDGQFVRDVLDDPLDDAAVRCFVDVARVLGVECVAEFVDRPEVLARIRELGVDYAQGFFLHKPEDMAAVLETCNARSEP
jgi:diguanylate cyclase (GGDEF)-like protein/PAS domain S-box-containing protein